MPDNAILREEGSYRLIRDSVASTMECAAMMRFADEHATAGDGYSGNVSPHAEGETFSGYSFENLGKHALRPGYHLSRKLLAILRRKPTTKIDKIQVLRSPGHLLGLELMMRTRATMKFSAPYHLLLV